MNIRALHTLCLLFILGSLAACEPKRPEIDTTHLVAAFSDAYPPVQDSVNRAAGLIRKNDLPAALAELEHIQGQALTREQQRTLKEVNDRIYENMQEVK